MDAKEQLRRYLEQRRESGEQELLLDQLTVDDVLRIVGVPPGEGGDRGARPEAGAAKSTPRSTAGPDHAGADWREVLRTTGASPDAGTRQREAREVQASAATPPAPASPPTESPVAGISVGGDQMPSFTFGPTLETLETLDAVGTAVASCTRCPLYSTATNPVPGEGNPNASLVIVGEAPGATEDEQGRPFVGAAGQLLTKILAAVDLRREDVFICNVLKHRPPGNRNPLPDEVAACSPYLVRQIELIRPKAILALGTFAAQTLLQTKLAIGKLRSQVHRYYGVPLIVTYHPAALLRNPSWKRPTWEDVQLVRRILDSTSSVTQP
ncbi:MAG: uracil-DNA glycosylase [Gemmatimonadaceae bacterium]